MDSSQMKKYFQSAEELLEQNMKLKEIELYAMIDKDMENDNGPPPKSITNPKKKEYYSIRSWYAGIKNFSMCLKMVISEYGSIMNTVNEKMELEKKKEQ